MTIVRYHVPLGHPGLCASVISYHLLFFHEQVVVALRAIYIRVVPYL